MRLPYGINHFGELRRDRYEIVDKTRFIPLLESDATGGRYLLFCRPKRFGKSLLITMLDLYYDRVRARSFNRLFGDLDIGREPTENKNQYVTLRLDLSGIDVDDGPGATQIDFRTRVRNAIQEFFLRNWREIPDVTARWDELDPSNEPAERFRQFLAVIQHAAPPKYLFIDGYDEFAQDLMARGAVGQYRDLISATGFIREFYGAVCEGARAGILDRVFVTGCTPFVMNELADGPPLFRDITHSPEFDGMTGWSREETSRIAETVLESDTYTLSCDGILENLTRDACGYQFADGQGSRLYQPEMVVYFLEGLEPPDNLPEPPFDLNLHTDFGRLRRLVQSDNSATARAFVSQMWDTLERGRVPESRARCDTLERAFTPEGLPSLFRYMGLLSPCDPCDGQLSAPSEAVRQLMYEVVATHVQSITGASKGTASLVRSVQQLAYQGELEPFVNWLNSHVVEKVPLSRVVPPHVDVLAPTTWLTLTTTFLAASQVLRPISMAPGMQDVGQSRTPPAVFVPSPSYPNGRFGLVLVLSIDQGTGRPARREKRKTIETMDQAIREAESLAPTPPDGWTRAILSPDGGTLCIEVLETRPPQ